MVLPYLKGLIIIECVVSSILLCGSIVYSVICADYIFRSGLGT
jgi:hypothetical protein